jgi:type I restriction enzyme S subunit
MLKNEDKLVPEIRFKGFTDAWEQRKLGEVAEFNPKSTLPEQFEYVDLESVVGTTIVSHRTEHIESAPSRAQRLAKQGDVFYQTVRPYQRNNCLFDLPYNNYVFSTGYAQLRPKGDSYFLLSRLQEDKFVADVLDKSTGTSYPAINSSDLAHIEIGISNDEAEQTAIGNFFRILDGIIATCSRKLTSLRKLKKAYLQQMFPQAGERVPSLRFAGFTGDWEKRKLGEVAEFSKGNGYSKGDLAIKGTPIILYGRLYTNYETIIENVDTFVEMKEKSVISQGGEVIVPSSGETAEDISRASVVNKPGVILGGDLNVVKADSTIHPVFLAITISNGNQQKELSKRAQGKSVVHINNSDLKEVGLHLPSLPEQTAVGNFFRVLDNTIETCKHKLSDLRKLKKAYLQQMFPQEGESVPKMRFAGFSGDWEERRLRDFVELITKGTTPIDKFVQGNVNFVKIENIESGEIKPSTMITEEEHENYLKRSKLKENDILFSIAGTLGRTAIVRKSILPANTNQALAIIRGYDFEQNFLITSLNTQAVVEYIQKNPTVGAQPNLSLEQVGTLCISTPSFSEQTTIGNFFLNLDKQIAIQQIKLNKLKQLKSAYLQKMFV